MERFRPAAQLINDRDAEPETAGSSTFPGLPGRFCMYYLPELDLHTDTITRCEALLRWWHPHYGMLRPGPSLGGTRWTDQVCEIEEWSMVAVCQQTAEWHALDPTVETALNVSATHLLHPHFLASIDRALGSTGMDPACLTIDVPYGALAMDPLRVARITERISMRGMKIAIDGINGTPRSAALAAVEASAWKIDLRQRGRRNPGLHPTVEAAVEQAHAAGAQAVAKAVEDDDVLYDVRTLGFDRAFGHAIGTAVTARSVYAGFRLGAPRRGPLFQRATPEMEDAQAVRSR